MSIIKLDNVRIVFPHLFKRSVHEGKEGKYMATFLIRKSRTDLKKKLNKAIAEIIATGAGKITKDRWCLTDGDFKTEQGETKGEAFEGCWYLVASNDDKPYLADRKADEIVKNGVLYSGCNVNVHITLWRQDNSYGKRVNANLLAVQFHSDGEALSNKISYVPDFDNLDGDSVETNEDDEFDDN